ncbi:MAG TPA: septal ring lytic transglycosylase RlpA family protein [Candidatus Paceibacterota bacterium]
MRLLPALGAALFASSFFASAHAEYMVASFYHAPRPEVAAHRSLPKGTWLKLTNPRNGRVATVVIGDRGPFVRGRTLDISVSRAHTLGFVTRGVATLVVERLN